MSTTILLSVALLILLVIRHLYKNIEGFKVLCTSVNHRSLYPYKDDQKRFYAEFQSSKYTKILGKKRIFKIVKDVENPMKLEEHLEKWMNSFKDLKKKKSIINVVDLTNKGKDIYEFKLHRTGRNHAKVAKASIAQSEKEIIIKNFEVIGVIDEYTLLHGDMSYSEEGQPYLKMDKLENMWQGTVDEQLIRNENI